MKFFLFSLMLLVSITANCQQPSFAGLWEGKIDAGTALRIVLEFKTNGPGNYTGSLTSPDQSPKALPLDTVYVIADSIFTKASRYHIGFSGRLTSAGNIEGTFVQGAPFELNLKKVEKISTVNRPQTPVAPFSYNSEDISYTNKDQSIRFAGTLTWPKPVAGANYLKVPQYPVVMLISGSGPQDRDEMLFNHKPFAVIADDLTKRGFAVLRVDDRGVGRSTGNFSTATTADFADDVEDGLRFLKSKEMIDTNYLGLIGHSEGGMIAPMVASRRNDIKFIVLLAGPGIPIIDLMAEQVKAVALSSDSPNEMATAGSELMKIGASEINKQLDSASTINNLRTSLEKWISQKPDDLVSSLHLSTAPERESYIQSQFSAFRSPWFRYFLKFDPAPYLQNLKCAVLALNGSEDIQVIAKPNLEGIKNALKKSRVKTSEVTELPGLNHLFQHCKTCNVKEYAELEETFSPGALKIMGDWLMKQYQFTK